MLHYRSDLQLGLKPALCESDIALPLYKGHDTYQKSKAHSVRYNEGEGYLTDYIKSSIKRLHHNEYDSEVKAFHQNTYDKSVPGLNGLFIELQRYETAEDAYGAGCDDACNSGDTAHGIAMVAADESAKESS